jgi:hypothetical protein
MTMMSSWLRSSRGGRVDAAMHCDDGVSASLNAYGWESCWLARGVGGGVVHLIDTCDIPCVFFVIGSLVALPVEDHNSHKDGRYEHLQSEISALKKDVCFCKLNWSSDILISRSSVRPPQAPEHEAGLLEGAAARSLRAPSSFLPCEEVRLQHELNNPNMQLNSMHSTGAAAISSPDPFPPSA